MNKNNIQKESVHMKKIETMIKKDLFNTLGLKVEHCSAYTEDSDSYIRINGTVTSIEKWNENYYLRMKANLYSNDDEIMNVSYDFDLKAFIEIAYESFSINCYKPSNNIIKYVEIYPMIVEKKNNVEFERFEDETLNMSKTDITKDLIRTLAFYGMTQGWDIPKLIETYESLGISRILIDETLNEGMIMDEPS